MKLSNSYNNSLSKIFSPVFFDSLAENNEIKLKAISSELFRSGIVNNPDITFLDAINDCYSYLCENYKNEYIYRNTIFQELVMKNHSFDECIAISEFRVGMSKADLAVFNGTSTVYEIKTELDTINRLESQLNDYLKFFDLIYIVTHQGFIKNIESNFPDSIGIYILDDNRNLTKYRTATSNKNNVSNEVLMASLRMAEYTAIIQKEYGMVPVVPNTKYYTECEKLFKQLDTVVAHDNVVKILLSRKVKKGHEDMIHKLPSSLKSISISKKYSDIQCNNILENLNKKISS